MPKTYTYILEISLVNLLQLWNITFSSHSSHYGLVFTWEGNGEQGNRTY